MHSFLAVENGLPPGLWLPTVEESTEQYLSDNFNHAEHQPEDIVDYGAFIVALAMLGNTAGDRVSYMPTQIDIKAMNKSGYGVSPFFLGRYYGGIGQLQRSLGFYPRGFIPSKDELIERLEWMAQYALDLEKEFGVQPKQVRTKDILTWGADRDLLPQRQIIYKVLDGDSSRLQRTFSIEKPDARKQLKALDLYRLGARVIRENKGPISQSKLEEKYGDEFLGTAYSAIKNFFGTYTRFWMEFGYVPMRIAGLSAEELVDLGIRFSISKGQSDLTKSKVGQLSRQKRFPSPNPIISRFGSVTAYNQRVHEGYEEYLRLREEYVGIGVSPEVFALACRRFESTPMFELWLKEHSEVMVKLSTDTNDAKYLRAIVQRGFELEDTEILSIQLADVRKKLTKIGIRLESEIRLLFELIPRVDIGEVLL